jgi:WD40-like Beta Propeller Repeat
MALLERPQVECPDEAEALFREARRRRRRRWVIGSAIVAVALLIGTTLGALASFMPRSPAAPRLEHTAAPVTPPTVNLRALQRGGRVAFVSRGALWVMDATTPRPAHVSLPTGVVPIAPTFSPDGRWLAFVADRGSQMQASLWMASATGAHPHRVAELALGDDTAFGWSPRTDLYAVAAGPLTRRDPFGQPTTIRLISPRGRSRTLATGPAIVGAAWSPDGSHIAVATIDRRFLPSLTSYAVTTGRPTPWPGAAVVGRDAQIHTSAFIVPAGWWRHWGVVYTVIANGAVPDGEGGFSDASLYAIASPGATPRYLGQTGTSTGNFAFVSDDGNFDRAPMEGKQVQVCLAASQTCAPVPAPAQDETLDPSWSPSGSTLAYVTAPRQSSAEFFPNVIAAWYAAHSLDLYQSVTGRTSALSSAGATVPLWSSNGSHLLYEASDGLWLTSPSGKPVEVAHPLYSQKSPQSFYGEIDWAQQFGWSAGGNTMAHCYVVCDTTTP